MKFFNWMQNKFNGGQRHTNLNAACSAHHAKQEPRKEEFSDWPHGLLTIGTFGNNEVPIKQEEEIQETQCTKTSSPDLSEFTPDEIENLQKELTQLLSKKQEIPADLPLDRFLNCPSTLEVDRRLSVTVSTQVNEKDEDIDRTIRVILGRCKDICTDKKAVGKKSISFLLKKMFVCNKGFPTIPNSFRDPLPETRMERLLRAMLKNKINPQHSQSSSARKFIEGRRPNKKGEVTEEENKVVTKWVKTDSEYIVLEI
ncbi:protein DEEPER ROOTING 1-like [Rutidosis leptorrhynchoides]|uniref:protein DEEPER ROOTING 1-like n=1 Tax=Rutidosis leptorrhynchoides TaxID=125765 RepID=UPI003A99D93A